MIRLLAISIISCWAVETTAQQVYFNNTYDFYGSWDVALSILPTDSGYMVAGGGGYALGDYWVNLMHINEQGDSQWKKGYREPYFYGYTVSGYPGSLTKTFDGNYALSGMTYDTTGRFGAFLAKFDSMGDTVWVKVYEDTSYNAYGAQCKQTIDSGFVITGATNKTNPNGNIFLMKTDNLGNIEWEQEYNVSGPQNSRTVEPAGDGGFIISGYTRSSSQADANIRVIKTDSAGNQQWSKTFFNSYEQAWCDAIATIDGGYLVATMYTDSLVGSLPHYSNRFNLYKLDSAGNTVWNKIIGRGSLGILDGLNLGVSDVKELNDGSFMVLGSLETHGSLLKVSADGDSLWYREYEYQSDLLFQHIRAFTPTEEGGFAVCGFLNAGEPTGQDMWVFKTDSMGCLEPGCDTIGQGVNVVQVIGEKAAIKLYPNPAREQVTIEWKQTLTGKAEAWVMDLTGKILLKKQLLSSRELIDVSNLSPGLYLVQIRNERGMVEVKRLSVLR